MDIEFSKGRISTITCLGDLYHENIGECVNLKLLATHICISDKIVYLKYVSDTNSDEIIKGVSNKSKKNELLKKSTNTTKYNIVKKRKSFSNSITIEFNISQTEYPHISNTKIYKNGTIQITGVKSRLHIDSLFKIINTTFSQLDELDRIFSSPLNAHFKTYAMVMYHLKLLRPENIRLDQTKIYELIRELNDKNILCIYENSQTKHLGVNYTHVNPQSGATINITYYIFSSGTINITALKSLDEIDIAYNFITKFITKYYDRIVMFNKFEHTINNLLLPLPPQKSDEWKVMRRDCITASESQYVLLREPMYKTLNLYMIEKAMSINGHSGFTGNDATRWGEMFEPIACQLYTRIINHKCGNLYNIVVYDTGFHKSPSNPRIGASPDGVCIKFSKHKTFTPPTYTNYPSVDQLTSHMDRIADIYLLEIKCPTNYHEVSTHADVKKLKPNYYCQMQTQLYVMKLDYCVFMNNKFVVHNNINELVKYKNENNIIRFGIFLKLFLKNNTIEYIYPNNVMETLSVVKSKLRQKTSKYIKMNNLQKIYDKVEYVYWSHDEYKLVEIDFNSHWWERRLPRFKKIYKKILKLVPKYKDGLFYDSVIE